MITKAELWREIDEVTTRIETNNKDLYVKHDIQKFKDALDEAKRKYYDAIDEINKPLQAEIERLRKEIADINNIKALVVPKNIDDFVKSVFAGTTWYGQWKVKWFSPDERYVYATLKGRREWYCIGQTKYYSAMHRMWDRLSTKQLEMPGGHDAINRRCMLFEHEGRLSAETLKEWKEKAMKGGQ